MVFGTTTKRRRFQSTPCGATGVTPSIRRNGRFQSTPLVDHYRREPRRVAHSFNPRTPAGCDVNRSSGGGTWCFNHAPCGVRQSMPGGSCAWSCSIHAPCGATNNATTEAEIVVSIHGPCGAAGHRPGRQGHSSLIHFTRCDPGELTARAGP